MLPISRRFVLTGTVLVASSLLVPITISPVRAAQKKSKADYNITDWIIVASTGEVTLGLSQPEVGQGSYTVLPQIIADELDADWDRVRVRFVTGTPAYKISFRQEPPTQKEGASMSTTAFYDRLRTAGAAGREVLTPRRSAEMGCRAVRVPHRQRLRDQRASRQAVLRRARLGCRDLAAERGAAPQGPEPVFADR
jgi:isoquinoline 1-oxidoreductase beta subunit